MNGRISRLYRALALGFVALIGMLTYWQVWAAPSLEARQDNPRLVYRELSINRGRIVSSDGVTLASNRTARANGRTIYFRRYPRKGETAPRSSATRPCRPAGPGSSAAGNDYLTGAEHRPRRRRRATCSTRCRARR